MLNAHNTVNYRHICFNFILMHLLKSGGGKHKLSVFKVFILVPNHHSNKIKTVSLWKAFLAVHMRLDTFGYHSTFSHLSTGHIKSEKCIVFS